MPEAWIAPPETRERRELVRYRCKLVRLPSGLKAQVHAVMVDLKVLYSTRILADYEAVLNLRRATAQVPITPAVIERAIDIQHELARRGHHRLPIPDVVIAAAAESADLTILHYDADYDRIAEVTRQQARWVAPRGSV